MNTLSHTAAALSALPAALFRGVSRGTALRLAALFSIIAAALAQASAQGFGQMIDPIKWSASVEGNSSDAAVIRLHASIESGWHLYSLNLPEGGPNSTSIDFNWPDGVTPDGALTPSKKPIEKYDDMFALNLSWWEGSVTFTQKVKITDSKTHTVGVTVSYQGCNDQTCIAPKTESLEVHVGTGPAPVQEETADTVAAVAPAQPVADKPTEKADWWAPVTFPETGEVTETNVSDSPWWVIFIWGFGGGLLALLTPCVWPMIPMTVSFFLKKGRSCRRSITDAITYAVSIIVIYLVLGIAITMAFGASKLNDIATSALFNVLFFALLVVFAVSFFGAFEIKLPSRWSNAIDSKAESTTGFLSIFFMAFTLVLVSFSCTGPIIGTLLVEAVSQGSILGPALGMGGFALGMALPFGLFAFFPSMLKEMPKSGSWLNTVKVVLGFI